MNRQESIPLGQDGILAPSLGRGFADTNLRYTINGYMFGNMPIMTMKKGQRVRWYRLALGDSNNFHTPHWHGNVVDFHGRHTDVVAVSPAQMETVDMIPDNPGIWLFHCHVSDHMAGGMVARYQVLPWPTVVCRPTPRSAETPNMQSRYGRSSNPVWQILRERRRKLGVSQEAFADLCELDRTYVGGIERGERNVALVNIEKLARALKISLSELFRGV